MPLVSVIMPVNNRKKYLADAIESILAQTFADFEFIIVDDASQDGSADIVRHYQKEDARIHLIQLQKNEGPGSARNHGIRAAQGEYIAAMDSDDISLPERLRRQVEFLGANPGIGAVGAGARHVNDDLSPHSAYRAPGSHAIIVLNAAAGGCAIVTASMMARRQYLLEIGGYNTHPDSYVSSDSELMVGMLADLGIRYGNIVDTLYLIRVHDSNISRSSDAPASTRRRRALERLWGEAPGEAVERFRIANQGIQLSWRDRRRARQDCRRLVDAMLAARWITADDVAPIQSEVNRRLETTTPRLWQMFCHWRRHRFGGASNSVYPV